MRKLFIITLLLLGNIAAAAPVYVEHNWLAKELLNKNIIIVDMTTDDVQYLRYHIPGAVRLAYADIVTKRRDKVAVRVADQQLYKVLGSLGISRDSHIVIYDDMGGLNAGRLFWELERIGHPEVSVLKGGLVTWVLEGHKVENKPLKPARAVYIPGKPGRDNEAGLDDVRDNDAVTLLDVRSRDEYLGHPRYPRSGHIPGAKWWPWQENVDFENGFVPRQSQHLEGVLQRLGVTDKEQPVIVYCRSGHRASQSYLALRGLGFSQVRLYDGSMAEYAANRKLPLEKGN